MTKVALLLLCTNSSFANTFINITHQCCRVAAPQDSNRFRQLAGSMAACSRVVDKRRAFSISKAKVREAAAKNGDSHHHWGSKGQESALLIVTVAKHDMAPLFCFLFRECVCAPVHPNARIM